MATDLAVLGVIGRALWKPFETKTDQDCLHLAEALGYPETWRVVRRLDTVHNKYFDRIHAGPVDSDCDMWLNHAGAMEAASQWEQSNQGPYEFKGGHLLALQPKFTKGQKVQVLYEDEWYDAKILKVKNTPGNFTYQVYYPSDSSKQSGISQDLIRVMEHTDPSAQAVQLGFPETWQAYSIGAHRWKLVSPEGTVFTSKRAAMEQLHPSSATGSGEEDQGDPPWRTVGHDYLGRRVSYEYTHQVSARRSVSIVQLGTITGWISETDVDSQGKPGFLDAQGQPAKLFHVVLQDDKTSLYLNHMMAEQDLEEYEVEKHLLPLDEQPPMKKVKR